MKVSLKTLKQLLFLVLICLPNGISAIFPAFVSSIILYLGCACTLVMVWDYIHFKIQPCKLIYYEVLFSAILLIATVINGNDLLRCIKVIYKIISASIWMDLYLKRNDSKTLSILSRWCLCWLIINAFVAILIPGGLSVDASGNVTAVLDNINNMEVFWIPAFVVCLTDAEIKGKPFLPRMALLAILIFVPSYIYNCQTGEVLILALVLACLLYKYKVLSKHFTHIYGRLAIIALIIGFFVIVLMQDGGLVYSFFENKQTLLQRIWLWQSTIAAIAQKPILGWGMPESDYIIEYNQWLNRSPHNMYLLITYWGGLLSLGVFSFIIVKCVKKRQGRDRSSFSFVSIVCLIAMLAYFMVEVTIIMPLFFMMLILMYNWNYLCNCRYDRVDPAGRK